MFGLRTRNVHCPSAHERAGPTTDDSLRSRVGKTMTASLGPFHGQGLAHSWSPLEEFQSMIENYLLMTFNGQPET